MIHGLDMDAIFTSCATLVYVYNMLLKAEGDELSRSAIQSQLYIGCQAPLANSLLTLVALNPESPSLDAPFASVGFLDVQANHVPD